MKQLRAILILVHLVLVTLMAAPAPVSGMRKALFKSDQGQEQLAGWAEVARAVGWRGSDQDFEALIWETGRGWLAVRAGVLGSFAPWFQHSGTRQGWRMFSVVGRRPTTLEIEVQRGEGWERVFVTGDELAEQWRDRQLDQERVRAFLSDYAQLTNRKGYDRFVRGWVAPALFADDPAITSVRVQLRRRVALPAARARTGERGRERLHWRVIVRRGGAE